MIQETATSLLLLLMTDVPNKTACCGKRKESNKPTDWLCLLIVVIASALAMSPNVADPDLWGHVQFGRDVLSDGQIAATTSYSYTASGYRWINHENLSEIAMAIIVDSIGPVGLIVGKFALSLFVIISVLTFNLKRGCGLAVSSILTLLVAANLGYHWSIRPQISSFVCFTALILLFQFSFQGWREHWRIKLPAGDFSKHSEFRISDELRYKSRRLRMLWLLVPLFLIWGNSHGGFVAGLCVTIAYLGMRAIEAICQGGGLHARNKGWGIVRRMALMSTVAVLATFINPYGPGLQMWLLESLGSPRPEISDWSTSQLFTIVGMKLWLLLAVVVFGIVASRKQRDATQLVVLALLLWQSISHFRHVPFFAIAAGFWIGPHLHSALLRFEKNKHPVPIAGAYRYAIQLGLVIVLIGASVVLAGRLGNVQVRRDTFPVDAIAFMKQNHLHGKLVVTYDWAQYSIAALCSPQNTPDPTQRSTVAFDGRFRTCYPQSIVDMHFDFLYGERCQQRYRDPKSPPIDPGRVLNHGQPNLVLLRRSGEITEEHMRQRTGQWCLLYQDAIAQVWGRRSVYDQPELSTYVPNHLRIQHNRLAKDSVPWPAVFSSPSSTTQAPGQNSQSIQSMKSQLVEIDSLIQLANTDSHL